MPVQEIRRTFYSLGENIPHIPCMLYEPRIPGERYGVMIVLEHSDDDYFEFVPALALAERGFRVMVSHVTNQNESLDDKLRELKAVVELAGNRPGVKKLILLGHSGGATLMSAYQAAAENGVEYFQGPEKLIPMEDIGPLSPADGVLFLDANFGNGAMTLLSLDPAVTDESDGTKLDPALDLYNPANGYGPEACHFSDEFIRRYWRGQADRMNRLIEYAQERAAAVGAGKGRFADDEPMVIPGGTQFGPCNKLFPQVPAFFSHTEGAWPLLHGDGSVTEGVVPCVRTFRPGMPVTGRCHFGALMTTVKGFLRSKAVRAGADFSYNESTLLGVDWDSSYCCTTGNVSGIAAPMLIMGMTGSYEYIASEHLYRRAVRASDKTLAFVEGASHNFIPAPECETTPGQFGDTVKACFDYTADWLDKRYL